MSSQKKIVKANGAAPDDLEAGPGVLLADPDVQEVLVVLELHVEARLVALDELVLEEEGFLGAARDDDVDGGQDPVEEPD